MLRIVAVVFWAILFIAFTGIVIGGGYMAWVGMILSLIALILTLLDWGNSDNPHDWSV